MLKPRIFISAVSGEFRTLRKTAAEVLARLGYDAEMQDIFGTEPGDLRDVLRRKIDDCDGLVHIAGRAYGFEPPTVDSEFGRVSYTQFEFLYAEQRGKKTWVLFPGDDCTRDAPLDRLDLVGDPGDTAAVARQQERQALQTAYCERLRASGHLWHPIIDDRALLLTVERLRDEFAELRGKFRRWQGTVVAALAVVVVLLVAVGGGVWWQQRSLNVLREDQAGIQQAKPRSKRPSK